MRRGVAIAVAAGALAGCGSAKNASVEEVVEAFLAPTRPDALMAAVVTERDYALAGWMSGARGGRILLKAKGRTWAPILCGGDRMTDEAEMERAGVPQGTANRLTAKLAEAEAKQDEAIVRRLSRFEPETCPGLPNAG